MYYAEVKLGADFDLTSILTEDGSSITARLRTKTTPPI